MKSFIAIIFALFLVHGVNAQNLDLSGAIGFYFNDAMDSVMMEAEKVENSRVGGNSGSVRVVLICTAGNEVKGSISGHTMASYLFPKTFAGGELYYKFSAMVPINMPAIGVYYVAMALLEYKQGAFVMQDYEYFTQKLHVDADSTGKRLLYFE